jgi:hypothetical protein
MTNDDFVVTDTPSGTSASSVAARALGWIDTETLEDNSFVRNASGRDRFSFARCLGEDDVGRAQQRAK